MSFQRCEMNSAHGPMGHRVTRSAPLAQPEIHPCGETKLRTTSAVLAPAYLLTLH